MPGFGYGGSRFASENKKEIEALQQELLELKGYKGTLGNSGKNHDGADGVMGKLTRKAMLRFEKETGKKCTLANVKAEVAKQNPQKRFVVGGGAPVTGKKQETKTEPPKSQFGDYSRSIFADPFMISNEQYMATVMGKGGYQNSMFGATSSSAIRTEKAFSAKDELKEEARQKFYATLGNPQLDQKNWDRAAKDVKKIQSFGQLSKEEAFGVRVVSEKLGYDPNYMFRLGMTESGFVDGSADSNSSAQGAYGWLEGSWIDAMKLHGRSLGMGGLIDNVNKGVPGAREALLELRQDPAISAAITIKETQSSEAIVARGLGIKLSQLNDADRYMAHFLGPGDAVDFLKIAKDPERQNEYPAVGKGEKWYNEAKANKGIYYKPDGAQRTYKEIYDLMGGSKKIAQLSGLDAPSGNKAKQQAPAAG